VIALIPIGHVDEEFINALRPSLEKVIGKRVRIAQRIALPWDSWNPDRGQHLSSLILAILAPLSYSGDRVLGVTDVDIYATGLNFIFGEADYVGGKALISLQRLRQEFYGLPSDEKLFQRRVLKEAVHELGHTYGLGHCSDPTCVMYFSNSLSDTDFKEWKFCLFCQGNVNRIV
jgi:archaemetzincin